jgi:hypothetical protein
MRFSLVNGTRPADADPAGSGRLLDPAREGLLERIGPRALELTALAVAAIILVPLLLSLLVPFLV